MAWTEETQTDEPLPHRFHLGTTHPGAGKRYQDMSIVPLIWPKFRSQKEFLTTGAAKWLHLERLAGYAPDFNPQKGVWNVLKRRELNNVCRQNLAHVREALVQAKERLCYRREVLQSCFLHALDGSQRAA